MKAAKHSLRILSAVAFFVGIGILGLQQTDTQSPWARPGSAGETIDFGGVPIGQTATATYTFRVLESSETSATVTISQPNTPFGSDAPTHPFTLAPGQSITINVTFAPPAVSSYTGSFTITAEGGYPPQRTTTTVSLTGRGVASGDSGTEGTTSTTTPEGGSPLPGLPFISVQVPSGEAATGPLSGTTDDEGGFSVSLSPTSAVTGHLSECEGEALANREFLLTPGAEGYLISLEGYVEESAEPVGRISLLGLESIDLGEVCLTPLQTTEEECEAIRREYEELSRRIEERKQECDCDDLREELAQLEAELANAEEDLELARQKKEEAEGELASAQQEFVDLLQRIQRCYGGSVWVYEYEDTEDLKQQASEWGSGSGASYVGSGRKGVPGGIALIGPVQTVLAAGEACRQTYQSTYGESLSSGFTRLKDLRATKRDLESAIEELEADIEAKQRSIDALRAEIAQKKAELDACIQDCLNDVDEMEQERDALVREHARCLERLERERRQRLEEEREEREAAEGIGKAEGKIKTAEDEADDAEDAISDAEEEIGRRVDTEEAEEKLRRARREYEEGRQELDEAKRKLKEAKDARDRGDFEKAERLAEEAREDAASAYKKLAEAKQRAKSARSSAARQPERCEDGEKTEPRLTHTFVWEKVLDIVAVPFGGIDTHSEDSIKTYLEMNARSANAMTFIKVVEGIRGLLEAGGGLVEGALKGLPTLVRVIRAGEEVVLEGIVPKTEVDRIFDMWKDIMAAHGAEIYLKVEGRDHTRSVWRECVNGRWVTMREDSASPPEIRYEYLGVIAEDTDAKMKEELKRILEKESAKLLEKRSRP